MTAEEFEQWRVMFSLEELHPRAQVLRQAQLLAAIANGVMQRRGSKKPFTAADFMPPDPWAPPEKKKKPPTAAEIAAQVKAMNANRKK